MNAQNINDDWKACSCLSLKRLRFVKVAQKSSSLQHDRHFVLQVANISIFPFQPRVSSKFYCLKSRLNPDRSCLAFIWETSTTSNTCAGEIIGAFSGSAVLQSSCTVVLDADMSEKRWMDAEWRLLLAEGDTVKAAVTFQRSVAFNTEHNII